METDVDGSANYLAKILSVFTHNPEFKRLQNSAWKSQDSSRCFGCTLNTSPHPQGTTSSEFLPSSTGTQSCGKNMHMSSE